MMLSSLRDLQPTSHYVNTEEKASKNEFKSTPIMEGLEGNTEIPTPEVNSTANMKYSENYFK